tara:strand:- start:578 stop:3061 length:2484 start_codon:yes stop_codon:yes gene_type:complete
VDNARALFANYPCCLIKSGSKAPEGTGWQENPRSVEQWRPGAGVGVICGEIPEGYTGAGLSVHCLDVDTPTRKVADAVQAWLAEYLYGKGEALKRTGKPPKFAVPFVCREKLRKTEYTTARYYPPGMPKAKENAHQLEVLGAGNQFVAYGIHPDTEQPYLWAALDGITFDDSLHRTCPADLVELSRDDLEAIKAAFERIAKDCGLVLEPLADVRKRNTSETEQAAGGKRHSAEIRQDAPGYTLAEVLPHLRNSGADYDDWQRVGAAIKQAGGTYDDWLAYSRQCADKHDEREMPRKWQSFEIKPGGAGMGTLARMALQAGMPSRRVERKSAQVDLIESRVDASWPDLADPFAEYPVPAFPLEVLPVAFRKLAEARAAQSGFDVGGYAFCLLVAAANTCDHRTRLNLGPFSVPPFQWAGLVGDSGAGKSPIINTAKAEPEAINERLIRDSGEALAAWSAQVKASPKEDTPPRPPWKQRHALDTTTEALGQVLVDNPEGVNLYHHEITEFLGRMDAYSGRDGGKDRGVFLRAYDGGMVTINRASKQQPMVVPDFSVGILAGIQPEVLAQKFKQAGAGADGLYQRFILWCLRPAGEVDYVARVDSRTDADASAIFRTLADWCSHKPHMVNLAPDAQRAMQDYHNHVRKLAQRTPAKRFAEHLDKFPGMLGRTAFALHMMQAAESGGDPLRMVTAETMERARALMGVLYRHSEAVYRVLDQEAGQVLALVKSAAEAILCKQWDTFKRGDLTRNATHWQGADYRDAEGAIDYLIELGWIIDVTPPATPGKRGRRSAGLFLVNPEVHTRFEDHATRITAARAERYAALQKVAG